MNRGNHNKLTAKKQPAMVLSDYMSIETAVLPLAGAGTRVFPETTAIEKCMVPVYEGDRARPLVDYMVEACSLAGLRRVIFVCSERGRGQLQEFLEPQLNKNLQAQLERLGKTALASSELARREAYGLEYEYVVQPPSPYGTAVPTWLAKDHLAGESHFVQMGGDDFVYRTDGTSELKLMLDGWKASGAAHALMGNPVPREAAPRYGILKAGAGGRLADFDEKPPLERVPARPLANISQYVFGSSIWPFIEAEMHNPRHGQEHFITYPILAALQAGEQFHVHPVSGHYFDGGNPGGLRHASDEITRLQS